MPIFKMGCATVTRFMIRAQPPRDEACGSWMQAFLGCHCCDSSGVFPCRMVEICWISSRMAAFSREGGAFRNRALAGRPCSRRRRSSLVLGFRMIIPPPSSEGSCHTASNDRKLAVQSPEPPRPCAPSVSAAGFSPERRGW